MLLVDIITCRCMMCLSSDVPCHLCVVTHKCGYTAKSCGVEPWMVRCFLVIHYLQFIFNLHMTTPLDLISIESKNICTLLLLHYWDMSNV